jgi:hypothetical protein
MLVRAVVLWITGLLMLVPYGTYYLLFEAPREQYALLIVGILFWIFGYWGAVGPLLVAVKARRVLRTIEEARSNGDLVRALQSPDSRDVAIDLIASENHIPRFLASRVYKFLVGRLSASARAQKRAPSGGGRDNEQ